MATNEETKDVRVALPAELHRRLKIRAAELNLPLAATAEKALAEWLASPGRKP